MKVVIFGATGRMGRHLVERALQEGHEITGFVRDPSKLVASRGRLRVVRGDVMDPEKVEEAIAGQDGVLSALGHTKSSAADVQARGTENIVRAMKKHGVGRLVSLTGAGVWDGRDRPKLFDRAIGSLLKLLQRDILEDAERHVEIIKKSGLDWVIVRAPVLTEGERRGEYRVGYVGKNSGSRISRADVADFMLSQLADDEYIGQMPMVSY